MSILRIASAVALLSVLGTTALAAAPLQPLGKWRVDFGDANCVAMRNYGTAEKPITLAFKPAPMGDVTQLTVVYSNGAKQTDQYDATIAVDQSSPVKTSLVGFPSKGGLRVNSFNLSASMLQPVKQASVLHLRSSGEIQASFVLSNMASVAKALDQCVNGLREAWNLDGVGSTIVQEAEPINSLPGYFSSNDYPAVALSGKVGGTTALVLLIAETGKIANCMATSTSGYASLDSQSCAVLVDRARFRPAIGSDGKPMKSGLVTRIRWQLPD